jgi:hypothetical protein
LTGGARPRLATRRATLVHGDGPDLSFGLAVADKLGMSQDLRSRLARGEYSVDADAVARAMITRARALRIARHGSDCSQVLVTPDRIEVRRISAAREPQSFPVQRTA